jgi:hypothetical protein
MAVPFRRERRFLLVSQLTVMPSHLAMSAPWLHAHYRRFNATMGRAAIFKCIGISHFGDRPYSFSLGITWYFPSSIPKPESDSRCLYTGHRTAHKQAPAMLFPRERGTLGFDVIWLSFDASSAVHFRSSLRPLLDGFRPPFNRLVHDLAVASSAAGGSLKSAPAGRSRWASHHLRHSIARLLEALSWHTPSGKFETGYMPETVSCLTRRVCFSGFERYELKEAFLRRSSTCPQRSASR